MEACGNLGVSMVQCVLRFKYEMSYKNSCLKTCSPDGDAVPRGNRMFEIYSLARASRYLEVGP